MFTLINQYRFNTLRAFYDLLKFGTLFAKLINQEVIENTKYRGNILRECSFDFPYLFLIFGKAGIL